MSKIDEKVSIGGITCTLAQGGIHSEDDPGVFKSDDDYVLIDSDVASFYPYIILNEGIVPSHLDKDRFLSLYRSIVERRIEAKKSGDKTTANTLKITINSSFGLMGFPYYWLYDMKCMYQVTISGQLYLLDLAEKLLKTGSELISMNTDGVLFKVKRTNLQSYYNECEKWQERTGFELEHSQYKLYARRDVNNYIAITNDDKIKSKGIFVDGLNLNKRTFITSFNAPIIALSLQSYFKDDIEPETTIKQETDIHNFLFSQRIGSQFKLIAQKIERGKLKEIECQKTNRWIVSKKGYRLLKKHRFDGNDSALMKGCNVKIANDINDVDLKQVDRQYYIDETWKIINEVQGSKKVQMALFG